MPNYSEPMKKETQSEKNVRGNTNQFPRTANVLPPVRERERPATPWPRLNPFMRIWDIISGRKSKRLQCFTKMIGELETKWPPEQINKVIHMIWIGTEKIKEENIKLSIETAEKNPDYNTTIIYDSRIKGYSDAKDSMAKEFEGKNITLIDLKSKSYFHDMKEESSFKYYENAILDGKYAQASDLLRLLVLKYEGGIYKDIDDKQEKGFGSLAFPKGIGVKKEYTKNLDKTIAFPNTPIAATKDNPIIIGTLEMAVENYQRGETDIFKLAGPDVFTKAIYQMIPEMHPRVLNHQMTYLEQEKKCAWRNRKILLTPDEIKKISHPYEAIRELSKYVTNGGDNSWNTPSTSTKENK
ncbi:hypothetical protein Z042_02555 [Chania multitudinisentens RB-25]|uniref:Uncharacterized protein n=1 Tax=Chania multitudinisentens RB-25 TaxID=1441930 RepID=W0LFG7_9GAMM|nr:TcdA/TcdB catalytic glycosyltransferase domain-containing protein [Chania multitudinisentens]AHG22613.1 hypothetical protein Z042_02555 [Chania multitudinisentens RB-25]